MTAEDRIKEIDKRMEALRRERKELLKRNLEEAQRNTRHNIGRCFKAGNDRYVIITDVPQDDGYYYHTRWFPVFVIDERIDTFIKFYTDEAFSRDGMEFRDNEWEGSPPWVEISQDEFSHALSEAIDYLYLHVFHSQKEDSQ